MTMTISMSMLMLMLMLMVMVMLIQPVRVMLIIIIPSPSANLEYSHSLCNASERYLECYVRNYKHGFVNRFWPQLAAVLTAAGAQRVSKNLLVSRSGVFAHLGRHSLRPAGGSQKRFCPPEGCCPRCSGNPEIAGLLCRRCCAPGGAHFASRGQLAGSILASPGCCPRCSGTPASFQRFAGLPCWRCCARSGHILMHLRPAHGCHDRFWPARLVSWLRCKLRRQANP